MDERPEADHLIQYLVLLIRVGRMQPLGRLTGRPELDGLLERAEQEQVRHGFLASPDATPYTQRRWQESPDRL